MKLHKMKVSKGVFETVLTLTLQAVESIAKLRLSELAKLPFALEDRKIKLIEAERIAPGRELAHVWKARESFGRSPG